MSKHDRALAHYTAMAREAELAQSGLDALYEVYSTDADEIHGELLHQGFCRDIAESKMFYLFRESEWLGDFLVYNRKTMANEMLCLSADTLKKREECSR